MKKLVLVFLILFSCSFIIGCSSDGTRENDNGCDYSRIADLYSDVLKDYNENARYDFYDLNGDDCKELLISPNDSHATQVVVVTVDQASYEPIVIGEYGAWGSMNFDAENGYITEAYLSQGVFSYRVYRVEGAEAKIVKSFYNTEDSLNEIVYMIDDEEVSKEKYEKEIEKFTNYENEIEFGYNTFEYTNSSDIINLGV